MEEYFADLTIGEWVEYKTDGDDDEYKAYYYNIHTKETTWSIPPDYATWKNTTIDKFLKLKTQWRRFTNDAGRAYYYNKETKANIWTQPDELKVFEEQLCEWLAVKAESFVDDATATTTTATTTEATTTATAINGANLVQNTNTLPSSLEQVSKRQKVNDDNISTGAATASITVAASDSTDYENSVDINRIISILSSKDAIIEPTILDTIQEALALSIESNTIYKCLSDSFAGYPYLINIMIYWLQLGTKLKLKQQNNLEITSSSCDKEEDVLLSNLAALIKSKFNREKADELIANLSIADTGDGDKRTWLNNMVENPIMRKLLIELHDQHRQSAMLSWCVKSINDRGYYKELAQSMKEVDNFDVFESIIVNLCSDIIYADTNVKTGSFESTSDLLGMLLKICSSNEYSFVYTHDLLKHLELKLASSTNGSSSSSSGNISCRVKRLRQELEVATIWKKKDGAASISLTSAAVVALKLTRNYNDSGCSSADVKYKILYELFDLLTSNSVTSVHLQRLCMYYLDISSNDVLLLQADELYLSSMLHGAHTTQSSIYISLLHEPQLLSVLLDYYINPSKLQQPATNAAQANIYYTNLAIVLSIASASGSDDVSVIYNALQVIRRTCPDIVKMAYGAISYDSTYKLIELMHMPIVSMCLLRWVHSLISSATFMSKKQNLSLLPLLLHLVAVASQHHPLQHEDCFNVLSTTLLLSASSLLAGEVLDTSTIANEEESRKRTEYTTELFSIKNDAMDCMVYLIGQGYVSKPIDFLTAHVSSLDSTTIRHMVHLLVHSVQCPYSLEYTVRLMKLLCRSDTVKALCSVHFSSANDRDMLLAIQESIHACSYSGGSEGIVGAISKFDALIASIMSSSSK